MASTAATSHPIPPTTRYRDRNPHGRALRAKLLNFNYVEYKLPGVIPKSELLATALVSSKA